MNIRYFCTLAATFAAGVGFGALITKRYYRAKTEAEIESIKAVYTVKRDQQPAIKTVEEQSADAEAVINKKQKSSIDDHKARKQENYVKYNFGVSDEEPINFSDAIADHEAEEMTRRRAELNLNTPPVEIDEENVGEIPSYDQRFFFYFQGDSTLTDDLNDIVDDKRRYLGDAIETIDNNSNEYIYLRDDRTSTYFIVHIYPGKYSDDE